MRKTICIIIATIMSVAASAQSAKDFAQKFVEQCDVDTALQCVTISPSMMEQLTKKAGAQSNTNMAKAIQKLKSARIVTTSTNGEEYYKRAEDLLKRNSQRFTHTKDYRNNHSHGTFYVRKTRNGDTTEMVMLHADRQTGTLVIVNLTGDIDEEFVNSLTQTFGNRKAVSGS